MKQVGRSVKLFQSRIREENDEKNSGSSCSETTSVLTEDELSASSSSHNESFDPVIENSIRINDPDTAVVDTTDKVPLNVDMTH